MSESPFELDHVFLAVAEGAPEIAPLLAAGFEEGPGNVHEGQGTACRRFFFENIYLELIWLEDGRAASAAPVRRTGLAARAGREAGASRLGLALRPSGAPDAVAPPVETWPYEAPYLPAGLAIPMAASSTVVREPLLFFMPWERRWSAPRIPHPNGARRVTSVSITLPVGGAPTPELRWLREWSGVEIASGPAERLRLELDGGARRRSLSLDPALPLDVEW